MNKHAFVLSLLSVVLSQGTTSAALPLQSLASPTVLPPFTFVGRLTDAAHIAYDADEIAEVRAYSADGTTLLAKTSTFSGSGTFCNFTLDIPVANSAADGRVTPGTKVKLVFLDADGNRYDSIVPDGDDVVGNPGGCKWVAAFLGSDENGDGIADEYAELYLLYGQYLGYDLSSFDAAADYDGDGQSNLAEYVAGTDPFLAEDVFDTQSLAIDFWPTDAAGATLADWARVTFPTAQGRCYTIYTTPSLDDGSVWRLGTFSFTPTAEGLTEKFYVTGGDEAGTCSLYLPKDRTRRFWRLVVE